MERGDHMTVAGTPKLTSTEKARLVVQQMANGMDRELVAHELGYKNWRGLDVLMRREGYVYRDARYVRAAGESPCQEAMRLIPQPIRITLDLLKRGNRNLEEIAIKAGLRSRMELAEYMRAHGWQWDSEQETYVESDQKQGLRAMGEDAPQEAVRTAIPSESIDRVDTGSVDNHDSSLDGARHLEQFIPLLSFLGDHEAELHRILSKPKVDDGTIPKYSFPGSLVVTKSVSMASTLDQLIRDFSQETGMSQRIVFEAALVQFLRQHGYAPQVDSLLKR